jgi:hypothetical protein
MKRFLKEYTTELIAGALILFGVFLVIERFEIRTTMLTILTNVINGILSVLKRILLGASNRAAVLTASDALGILLILLAAGFIVYRIRYRFLTDNRWGIDVCPKCSGPIMRVHRTRWDRALGMVFLPEARRYRCVDPQCQWSGLLRRHILHRHRRSEQISGTGNS